MWTQGRLTKSGLADKSKYTALDKQREASSHPVLLTWTAVCSWSICSCNLLLPLLSSPVPTRKTSFHITLKKNIGFSKTKMLTFGSAQSKHLFIYCSIFFFSPAAKPKIELFAQPWLRCLLNCRFWTYLLPSLLRGREGSRQCNGARLVVSILYRCMKACNMDT